jgi:hypothetical protein
MLKKSLILAAVAVSGGLAAPSNPKKSGSGYGYGPGYGHGGGKESQRAEAVIDAFRFAWHGYSKYCFGKDELHPVTNTCGNSRYANAWLFECAYETNVNPEMAGVQALSMH